MSPLRRSPDPHLRRLIEEGYDLQVQDGHLIVRDVPYVTTAAEVDRGDLVMVLNMAGERTRRPSTHVAFFRGDLPCDADGRPLNKILNSSRDRTLATGLEINHTFSSKPAGGYENYYDKVTTYVTILMSAAQGIDPDASAFACRSNGGPRDLAEDSDNAPFHYTDTASARAQIMAISARLRNHRVGIIGLGGTGSYVLDLVAKTHAAEIHIYDDDRFEQHTAFRSPGAATRAIVETSPYKVDHLAEVYGAMRTGIIPHRVRVAAANVGDLTQLDFVFICVDHGASRKLITDALVEACVPFIDTGLGVYEVDGSLAGTIRTTTFVPGGPAPSALPQTEDAEGLYDQNIQIADLNALNATLAVVRWKRSIGFYNDLEHETESLYDVDGNAMTNRGDR